MSPCRITACLMALAATLPAFGTPLPAQAYSDRLARLDELRRFAAIRGAVNDSGQKCGRVTAAGIDGPYKNLIMWTARCMPAKDFALFIGPDGSAQVRPCADLAQLRLPLCRRLP